MLLQFKNNGIKDWFLNNPSTDRIISYYKCENQMFDEMNNNNLKITNKEALNFMNKDAWEDLSVVCNLYQFEYAFIQEHDDYFNIKSYLGTICIDKNNNVKINGNGIFQDKHDYQECLNIFKEKIDKYINFIDIVYLEK